MSSLRQILDGLEPIKREALMIAFNNGISNLVEYEQGKFIGVHINKPAANIKITEKVGLWCIGEIKNAIHNK